MTHPLEIENEDLKKHIEATYDEILDVDCKLSSYAIKDMVENIQKNTNMNAFSNMFVNAVTFADITKYGE